MVTYEALFALGTLIVAIIAARAIDNPRRPRSLGQKSKRTSFSGFFCHASLNFLEIKQLFLRKFA